MSFDQDKENRTLHVNARDSAKQPVSGKKARSSARSHRWRVLQKQSTRTGRTRVQFRVEPVQVKTNIVNLRLFQ